MRAAPETVLAWALPRENGEYTGTVRDAAPGVLFVPCSGTSRALLTADGRLLFDPSTHEAASWARADARLARALLDARCFPPAAHLAELGPADAARRRRHSEPAKSDCRVLRGRGTEHGGA